MSDIVKLVLCGDRWPAKAKLGDNLILKVPKNEPLSNNTTEICKLLGIPNLSGLEVMKGKGKPPDVSSGNKLKLEKTPAEIGDKGGLVVLFFKETKKKEKSDIKVLVCGDDWPAPEKLSDYLMLSAQKDKKIEDIIPDLQTLLKLSSLDGYDICKGRGKAPNITPGAVLPLSQTPSELNLAAAALLFIKKRKSAEEKKVEKEEPKHKTIYQLGARVEVLDDDIDEWLPGNISFIREDGTYDVTLDKGGVESHTDVDDIRECSVCFYSY